MVTRKYIVFSDLDGTLLDHLSYSYAPANDALAFLQKNSIPLILVSSKTRPEMMAYQNSMHLEGTPFVVENGAAIYTKPGYFPMEPDSDDIEGLWCYRFGPSFERITEILQIISEENDYAIQGFHNTSESEIQEMTGLGERQTKMALQREYSVPLFFDDKAKRILVQEIEKYNLNILFGGRFMHLLGKSNKGDALRFLVNSYKSKFPGVNYKSIALGDSPNDFDMLAAADYPVLIKRHDGTFADIPQIKNLIRSEGIGPVGWNERVLALLRRKHE